MDLVAGLEIFLAVGLLVAALISYVWEKVRMEITSLALLLSVLVICGLGLPKWPTLGEAMKVFSSEAPLTITAMFMVSAALTRHRLIEGLSKYLEGFTPYGYKPFMFLLLLTIAIFSAFVNNTPVVVILLPVAISLAKPLGVSSSKMLIPISYASIFGGCCTLLGTSTNILASGFMADSSYYPNMEGMGMFELVKIGLPLLTAGLLFLVFFGYRLLPEREALSSIISSIDRKEFLTEAIISKNSPLLGQRFGASSLGSTAGLRLLDVVRDGNSLSPSFATLDFKLGDRLILTCKPQGLIDARDEVGVEFFNSLSIGAEGVSVEEAVMVEGMVSPSSSFIGKKLSDANFRIKHNVAVVAVHRRGKNLQLRLQDLRLKTGDTLLFLGTELAVEELRVTEEVILLDHPPLPVQKQVFKALGVIGILAGIVFSASTAILPLSLASLLGVLALVATRLIKIKEAFKAVEWNIIFLIYAMLSVGVAMEKTGGSQLLAEAVLHVCMSTIGGEWKLVFAIALTYLLTALLTELLSNNATIALMAPVSLAVAHQLGLDEYSARAFVLTTCIASSASFITPIGYQTNTFVYGVGGYRFKDFAKFGIWPMALYMIGTTFLVSYYWGFFP
ncbi:SLC13 family permease [Opitutales bacterium]|nr:SLC13 family permease [Opitutales bacterium]